MTIATFDPVAFKVRYPEFAAVSNAYLQACFDQAGLYLSNTDASPVQDIAIRTQLLWILTAHLAYLGGSLNPGGGALPVGRVSSATEGSVSASFDYGQFRPGSVAWFNQTQYGASFWAATVNLRGFHYIPQPTLV
jgi:hypothetical protein